MGHGTTDMLKRKEMLSCFLSWIMELVIELIKVVELAIDEL